MLRYLNAYRGILHLEWVYVQNTSMWASRKSNQSFSIGGISWEDLDAALLEQMRHWGWPESLHHTPFPVVTLCFMLKDEDVSS